MTQPENIIVKGLSVSYDRKRVLTNIFLDLPPGQLYGVIGPNGAGKSTLFKAMLGLIDVNAGSTSFQGKKIEDCRKEVVYVPQRDNVDWTFPATVRDIVAMGRYPHKGLLQRMNQEDEAETARAMKLVGISHLQERQIGALSGGQQQRVFLARALAQGADTFFLDEPFVGVDITTEERIIQILKTLRSEGKTILVVHHDLNSVEEYFDQVILLNQRLIAYGPTPEVFTEENISTAYSSQLNILHKTGMIEK
ncbi:MAG: metal ABC transporter ATP-binding protein [Bacteroidetes bacterium]|nr:metal ABC transporter ATP-binding protein [Bacteroidota bacterium]